MKNRLSKRSYKEVCLHESPIDLIVCEGENERDYLRECARSRRVRAHIIKGDGTDPKSIIKTAKERSKSFAYDKIFCIFDCDGHKDLYTNGIKQCYDNKFFPISSNPCFE